MDKELTEGHGSVEPDDFVPILERARVHLTNKLFGDLLASLPMLEVVNLSHTNIGDYGAKGFSVPRKLRRLNLKATRISDRGLLELTHLTQLERLNLGSTKITDTGLTRLASLRSLKELSLQGCEDLTVKGLTHLAGLEELRSLSLTRTPIEEDEAREVLPQVENFKF